MGVNIVLSNLRALRHFHDVQFCVAKVGHNTAYPGEQV